MIHAVDSLVKNANVFRNTVYPLEKQTLSDMQNGGQVTVKKLLWKLH